MFQRSPKTSQKQFRALVRIPRPPHLMRCSVLFRRTTTEPLDRSEDLRTAPGAFAIPMASEESYGDSRTQLSRARGIHQRQGVVRAQHPKVNCGLETLTPNSMRDSRTSDLASLPRRMVELLTERGSLRAVVRSLTSEYKSRRIIPTVAKKNGCCSEEL